MVAIGAHGNGFGDKSKNNNKRQDKLNSYRGSFLVLAALAALAALACLLPAQCTMRVALADVCSVMAIFAILLPTPTCPFLLVIACALAARVMRHGDQLHAASQDDWGCA